jgi:hypothetical protein
MSGSLDVPGMLHHLVEQQTALGQQQAALMQMQTELVPVNVRNRGAQTSLVE